MDIQPPPFGGELFFEPNRFRKIFAVGAFIILHHLNPSSAIRFQLAFPICLVRQRVTGGYPILQQARPGKHLKGRAGAGEGAALEINLNALFSASPVW